MHSTSFRMSVSIIVILGVFCKAHFKLPCIRKELPVAGPVDPYKRMVIQRTCHRQLLLHTLV